MAGLIVGGFANISNAQKSTRSFYLSTKKNLSSIATQEAISSSIY
jgi:hypothetical protein